MEITTEKTAEENPSGGGVGGVSSDKKRKRKRKRKMTLTLTMKMPKTMKMKKKKKGWMKRLAEEEEKRQKKQQKIQSDCRNIRGDFLCAEEFGKKFLVCNSDLPGERTKEVSIEQSLRNKSVGLLFAPIESHEDLYFYSALKEVYDQLWRDKPDAFEIVFVPFFPTNKKKKTTEKMADDDAAAAKVLDIYERNRDLFNSHFMRMPWLAVPFEDLNWRKHLYKKYQICLSRVAELLLFDPSSSLVQSEDGLGKLALHFGAEFYPFTAARELELKNQYLAPLRSPNPSLGALLSSDNRDFLISFDGDYYKKVPISQLQGKFVGIYLFCCFGDEHQEFMKILEDFRFRAGGNFEIIFVNVDFYSGYQSENSFHNFLKKHPWLLALPFKDAKIRALRNVLSPNPHNPLVIVGGGGGGGGGGGDSFFIDPYGSDVIEQYGFVSYPFTRDMAVKVEKKRLTTQLKLDDLFKPTKTKFLIYNHNGEKKPVSFLTNKKVILYVAADWPHRRQHIKIVRDLQIKDPSFHVLFDSLPDAHFSAIMPNEWLALPPDKVAHGDWKYKIFNFNIPSGHFIAFDDTGKLIKMGDLDLVRIDGDDAAFPFATDETFDKVLRDILIGTNEWDMEAGDNTL